MCLSAPIKQVVSIFRIVQQLVDECTCLAPADSVAGCGDSRMGMAVLTGQNDPVPPQS
jgi:hypothetical protein